MIRSCWRQGKPFVKRLRVGQMTVIEADVIIFSSNETLIQHDVSDGKARLNTEVNTVL